MDEKFTTLQKTKSLIGHERETVRHALKLCNLITNKWDHPSTQTSFDVHEAIAELLVAMNTQLAKDGGEEETTRLYNEIVDIRYRRMESKQW